MFSTDRVSKMCQCKYSYFTLGNSGNCEAGLLKSTSRDYLSIIDPQGLEEVLQLMEQSSQKDEDVFMEISFLYFKGELCTSQHFLFFLIFRSLPTLVWWNCIEQDFSNVSEDLDRFILAVFRAVFCSQRIPANVLFLSKCFARKVRSDPRGKQLNDIENKTYNLLTNTRTAQSQRCSSDGRETVDKTLTGYHHFVPKKLATQYDFLRYWLFSFWRAGIPKKLKFWGIKVAWAFFSFPLQDCFLKFFM